MSTMYCALCNRPVEARRHVGVGTIALGVLTAGIALLAIPFYPKRCSICRSTAVSQAPPVSAAGDEAPTRFDRLEHRLRLVEEELEATGTELTRLKDERDFYAKLLADPTRPRAPHNDG